MASVDMCEHDWPGSGCRECFPRKDEQMDDELVSAVADVLSERGCGLNYACEDTARAIIPLVATALRAEMPDEIDLFRILRKAGRSDKAKAQAVAAAIRGAA